MSLLEGWGMTEQTKVEKKKRWFPYFLWELDVAFPVLQVRTKGILASEDLKFRSSPICFLWFTLQSSNSYSMQSEMATHSSILAWNITWMVEPGWLLSMGSQRVGHDWETSLSIYLSIQQKRQGRTRTPRAVFKTSLLQANLEISQFLEKVKGNFI